jgi:hypothetical protein
MRSRAIVGADNSSAVPHIKPIEKAHVLIKTVLVRNITQAPFFRCIGYGDEARA